MSCIAFISLSFEMVSNSNGVNSNYISYEVNNRLELCFKLQRSKF